MLDKAESIPSAYKDYWTDPAYREVWGARRYPPADLSLALSGLRTMPECDERNTLADTVWWDIVERPRPSRAIVAAVADLRPGVEWLPPHYSLEQHRAIRRKLEEWGWHFTR